MSCAHVIYALMHEGNYNDNGTGDKFIGRILAIISWFQ